MNKTLFAVAAMAAASLLAAVPTASGAPENIYDCATDEEPGHDPVHCGSDCTPLDYPEGWLENTPPSLPSEPGVDDVGEMDLPNECEHHD